jgi:hypothetical protein
MHPLAGVHGPACNLEEGVNRTTVEKETRAKLKAGPWSDKSTKGANRIAPFASGGTLLLTHYDDSAENLEF